MNLKYKYWWFDAAIPNRVCDNIRKHGLKNVLKPAITKDEIDTLEKDGKLTDEHLKILKSNVRDSNIAWIRDKWVYREIMPYISKANKTAGWNFHYDFAEPMQFTEYSLNQYYTFHLDCFDEPYNKPNEPGWHGKIRKLTAVALLSDPSEFEGGQLEFDFRNFSYDEDTIWPCKEILKKGNVVVFPSFVWHQVKPVTFGKRHTLVTWALGNPYV